MVSTVSTGVSSSTGAKRSVVLKLLRESRPALIREFSIQRLAIFGSVARDEAGSQSDVDILVEVDSTIGLDFVALADRLEDLIGHKVDQVSRRGIKPLLWTRIERELIDV